MRDPFETSEVIELVGIRPNYLNKFVERNLYGVVPSDRTGEGRGSRRRFTLEDVFGIALVWWLFEAGLRSEVIKRVLRDISGSKKANANLAATKLRQHRADLLIVKRETRSHKEKQKWPQETVVMLAHGEIAKMVAKGGRHSHLILPIGELLADLNKEIERPV